MKHALTTSSLASLLLMPHAAKATLRAARLLPALLAAVSFGAHAVVYVEASSVSWAQNAPQGVASYARIVNGVSDPSNYAGPGGSSNTGGGPTAVWADTTQPAFPTLATTFAAADLSTGSLRVYAEASLGPTNAIGRARWKDTITFNNTTGQSVELDFFWLTEGTITPLDSNSWRTMTSWILLSRNYENFAWIGMKAADGSYANHLGGAQYKYYGSAISPIGGYGFAFPPHGNNLDGAWRTSMGVESGLISATLIIPAGTGAIDIDALLEVDCRSGAVCDFGHTSTFSFGALPAGLSWTSESEVFLSAAAIPEPATWVSMAAGLLVLALAVRRRTERAEA